MVELYEMRSRLRLHFAFSRKEVWQLLAVAAILGFVFSFRDWGSENQVSAALGLWHLLLAAVIALIGLFVHESAHRMLALYQGLKAEFRVWWGGLVTGVILAFASNGWIQLALPGGMVTSLLVRTRVGEFRYGLKEFEHGVIAIAGPLANLALAFAAKLLLSAVPSSWFLQKMLFFNIVLAVCTMLPIPPLDGITTFWGGRVLYALSFFGILGAAVFLYFTGIALALIGGAIVMVLATILYYFLVEAHPE